MRILRMVLHIAPLIKNHTQDAYDYLETIRKVRMTATEMRVVFPLMVKSDRIIDRDVR